MKAVVLSLFVLGTSMAWAQRDLSSFIPGRPTNVGNPFIQTFGSGVPSFQRPQIDPRPPSFQRPQVDPRPPTVPLFRTFRSIPQRTRRESPTPPPGYQQKPQVQPTPPPGHIPAQVLPAKSDLTKPVSRPESPQTLPAALPNGETQQPETLPASIPILPETLPGSDTSRPVQPATLPGILSGGNLQPAVTIPAVISGRPNEPAISLPASVNPESPESNNPAELPPKQELTKPSQKPERPSDGFAPLPVGPIIEPVPVDVQPLPAKLPPKSELTKPVARPPRPQRPEDGFAPLPDGPQVEPKPVPVATLPAQLPSAPELAKPVARPPKPDSPEDEFAPLPDGPQVEPQPIPGELTKPAGRPQGPHISPIPPNGHAPVQTLPAILPPNTKPFSRPPRPDDEYAPLSDGPQVEPKPAPGELTKPASLPTGSVAAQVLPANLPESSNPSSLPSKTDLTKPLANPPRPGVAGDIAPMPTGPNGHGPVQTLPAILPPNTKPFSRPPRPDDEYAPLPDAPQVEPKPAPGELTKPASRPTGSVAAQVLPANLPESNNPSSLPSKTDLTKPLANPPRPGVAGDIAPMPTGPQVEPRPPAGELTKPAVRPPRPQTLPATLPQQGE